MNVRKTNNKVEIISDYDSSSDLMLTIGRVSKNNAWQISDAYLFPNSTDSLSDPSHFLIKKILEASPYTSSILS